MRKVITLILVLCAIYPTLPFPRAHAQQVDINEYEIIPDQFAKSRIPAAQAKAIIDGRARAVLQALKDLDLVKLSTFVHPQKGVRFSTYAGVSPSDKRLSRAQLRSLARRDRRALWFVDDDWNRPMRMTTREYLRKYVYDHDYLRASRVSYNTQYIHTYVVPTVLNFYPHAIVVQYYEPNLGTKEESWNSLWLVFEKVDDTWYLLGIVKDTPALEGDM